MSDLTDLAEQWYDASLAASPEMATLRGVHEHDHRLSDPSVEAEAARRAEVRDFGRRAAEVAVGPDEQVVAAMLRETIDEALVELGDGTADQPPLVLFGANQMDGPQYYWFSGLVNATYPEPEHGEALLERYAGTRAQLDAFADRFAEAVDLGLLPVARSLERMIGQIDGYLAGPIDQDPLAAVQGPAGATDEWRDRLTAAVRDEVRPAFQTLRDRIAAEQQPHGRDDTHAGLSHLPGGDALYARFARLGASMAVDPEEVHRTGVDYVTGPLAAEWSELGASTLGESDPLRLMDLMRSTDALAYGSEQEMVEHAEAAMARAGAVMGDWFGRLPQADVEVVEAPPHLAGSGAPAWYVPPAPDGSRPGRYFLDTVGATSMLRSEGEATAFHEAIPGHHLQVAISAELDDVPSFLRHGLQVAYAEGWGLYAERLADEMGLYASDTDRLGMLSLDAFRAVRLVVDTGLHALGWTRQQAIEWMSRHTPLPDVTVAAEIDRYVAMPGQALGYKLGQLEIRRLRNDAEARLGDRFDVRGFHDAVLGSGMLTLPVLGDVVEGWVSATAA